MDDNIKQNIKPINLESEMKDSFLSYAMSVIAARALPDVRDGLKPVHRRILYAMNELNLDPGKAYKKSARIVGDTMGKYHPHGDSSIYDAMVRLGQDFSMRYTLVDGHGNYGSIDGDPPAAQRYTEARLSPLSMEMLSDIEKNTVDFIPNYDEESKEPTVLPARFPNLLVNGTSGIAVGMATNIPPHNLCEVIDGVVKIIDNHIERGRDTDVDELLAIIKGPDFPTGATILGTAGAKMAYKTGRGSITTRADVDIEVLPNGRERLVITSLPYQVNKKRLIEKISELVKEKRIEGIADLKDLSNRFGIKIHLDIKKDANSNVILNKLYKYTQLQENFSVNMLALVDGQPKILNLHQMLTLFLDHQKDVVRRRTQFDLEKALKRAHILEGLLKALDIIDDILKLIRASKDGPDARNNLIETYDFSLEQASAIVEMRFRQLTGLELEKLQHEFDELMILVKELEEILANENRLYGVIREEILVIKSKHGDERRTKLVLDPGEIDFEDLINDEMSVITMTHFDYIKRLPLNTYKSQNRGGKGIIGMQTREEDVVRDLFVTNTHSGIFYFTNKGKVYTNKGYEIPEAGRTARGTAIVNLLNLDPGEKIAAVIPTSKFGGEKFLIMVTKKGVIKKTPLSEFANVKKSGLRALTIREEDELIAVLVSGGNDEVFLATHNGMGVRFNESDVRGMGRTAAGVRGIKLRRDDYVVGAVLVKEGFDILFVSEGGFGKRTEHSEFNTQNRGGLGVRVYKISDKTGPLVGISSVNNSEELMLINSNGVIIRIRIADVNITGRVAMGVKLINLHAEEKVISIAKISEDQIVYESTDGEEDLEAEDEGTEREETFEEDLNE
ncbi:MAG: DNA gyrase subunit A [Clostridiales bacterium]|jgi:DNA gyrase subunit A|nr:DNA gyrase subunit A [Clostridiales bacterium]